MQLLNLTASLNGIASVHLNLTNHLLLLFEGLKELELPFILPCPFFLKQMDLVACIALGLFGVFWSFFVQKINSGFMC